ncbi:MAG: DUF1501 domain-containing protein [Tannerella sp.]|nr:DUF1501 domain-containing protein [Tannerella sp.]
MKRRDFFKIVSSLGVGVPFYLNGMPTRLMNQISDLQLDCDAVNDRVLVIFRLTGANDGLNTVIPINQYDAYSALRPTIKIPNSGTGSYIPLDTTVGSSKLVGLHPSLTGFKSLYDSGKFLLVNGVGYPNPNYSHFRGEALMFAGKDGTYNDDLLEGTFGKYFAALHPGLAGNPSAEKPDPLAIQLGDISPCLFYEHAIEKGIEFNMYNYENTLTTLSSQKSDYQDLLDYIQKVADSMDIYYDRVMQVFNSGSNSTVTYPDTSLGKQLKLVARMINGGSKTRIFQVNLSGFDTHQYQATYGSTHLGTHANLLENVGNSVAAFQADIQQLGLADRIMMVSFSEFGRQVRENANQGTDHGDLAPFFVIGNAVEAGILGDHPVFSNSTDFYYNQDQRRYDYRQIYGALLQDWLGSTTNLMQTIELDHFVTGAQKVDIIKNSQKAGTVCSETGNSNVIVQKGIKIYPVPASQFIYIELEDQCQSEVNYQIFDMSGRVVSRGSENFFTTRLEIDVSSLAKGYYIIKLKTNSANFSGKIMIAH